MVCCSFAGFGFGFVAFVCWCFCFHLFCFVVGIDFGCFCGFVALMFCCIAGNVGFAVFSGNFVCCGLRGLCGLTNFTFWLLVWYAICVCFCRVLVVRFGLLV